MLPSLRHRILITVTAILGVAVYFWAGDALRAADGAGGLSLLSARGGIAVAVTVMVVASLPALALAAVTSATGHPLTGVFSITFALALFTMSGGSTQEWAQRVALPRGYWGLIAESVVWSAWLVLMLAAMHVTRKPLRKQLALLVDDEHFGREMTLGIGSVFSLAGCAVSALVGGAVAMVLLRSPDANQVFGALMLAFAIGAFTAQMALPSRHAGPILFSPMLAAIVAYAYAATRFGGQAELLAAWYNQTPSAATITPRLPGLAMALPIQYISAGVAGCAIGYGLAQAFDAARAEAAATAR